MCYDRPTTRAPQPAVAGFTLIELLSVILIISLLAGLIVGVSVFAQGKARIAKTRTQIERIKNALEEYKLEKGGYPPLAAGKTIDDLRETDLTNWLAGDVSFTDPWNNLLIYKCDPNNLKNYVLYSMGPDKADSKSEEKLDNVQ